MSMPTTKIEKVGKITPSPAIVSPGRVLVLPRPPTGAHPIRLSQIA